MDAIALVRRHLKSYPLLKQFIKFSVVGFTSAVIHFSILFSLTEWVGVWYVYSNGAGFLVSASFNFFANKLWTFRNRGRGAELVRQILKFLVVLGIGLTINSAIIFGITEWIGLDYKLSWIFAVVLVAGWNFLFNRLWTFSVPADVHHDLPPAL